MYSHMQTHAYTYNVVTCVHVLCHNSLLALQGARTAERQVSLLRQHTACCLMPDRHHFVDFSLVVPATKVRPWCLPSAWDSTEWLTCSPLILGGGSAQSAWSCQPAWSVSEVTSHHRVSHAGFRGPTPLCPEPSGREKGSPEQGGLQGF